VNPKPIIPMAYGRPIVEVEAEREAEAKAASVAGFEPGALLFAVIATEDDYEPEIRTIAIFTTEAAAKAYADVQPECVYPYARDPRLTDHKRHYVYSVEPVPFSPAGDWKPRAE
jgi:hypothetical protein